jgi:hypothetical protein
MRSIHLVTTARAALGASLLCAVQCLAQSNASSHARDVAAAYEIRLGSATGAKLQLQPLPILPWTNPVPEKQMHGDVFVWTDDGRPTAVLNIFQMDEGKGSQEFHECCSLAETGISAAGPSERQWIPTASQLVMSPVPLELPQALNPRQRLAQMRQLALRFKCQKTNRKEETQWLRLLPQPLVRYESKSHGIIDGGLFVFVEATDPEAFLLLELHTADDMPAWRFGLARMASVQMQASLDDKRVWDVPTLPYAEYRNRPDLPYALLLAR